MTVAGPNPAGTGGDNSGVGTVSWNNTANIVSSNDSRATASLLTPGSASHYLTAVGFGFTITATSIDDVSFAVERQASAGACTDNSVKIIKAGTISGNERSAGAAWNSGTDAVATFAGSPATWGVTLADSDVNNANFGIGVSAVSAGGGATAAVDFISCTVTYTADDESSSSTSSLSSSTSTSTSSTSTSSLSSSTSTSSSSGTPCTPVSYNDWVKQTTTTTGTGTFVLDGTLTGFSTFQAAFGSTGRVCYSISDEVDFEVGIGTFSISGQTLTRDIIIASSNSHSQVSWGAGAKDIACVFPSLSRLPRGSIDGLKLANNASDSNHDIDISAGCARDHCDQLDLVSNSTIVKQLDAVWAAGTNVGGRFTASLTGDTWYHLFAIYKDTGRSVDFGFDTSFQAANRPAGYTAYRLLGSVLTDGSSNIKQFVHTTCGGIDFFRWLTPPLDIDDSTVSSSGESKILSVPSGRRVVAVLDVRVDCPALSDNDEQAYFYNDEVTASAASASAAPLASLGFEHTTNTNGAETRAAQGQVLAVTTTASTVKVATRNGFGVRAATIGWLDDRGRNA